MADQALFLALANALSRPSKALRATQSAGQAGQDIIGNYVEGKQLGQQLQQYKLLSTPLGSMYPDPSQIPFGLGPQHTVKDLLTIAPAMENYVPPDVIRGAAQSFGANVNDGSGGNGGGPPSVPPPTTNPAPLGGVGNQSNPAGPPGNANLNAIQGTGAGAQNNIPPGTPPAVVGPTVSVPQGGMSMKGFQNVVLPSLKAGQERSQFQQNQGREASQFATGQANADRRQQNEITAANNRTLAGETAKIAPSLTEAGTIQDDINALLPLYKGYSPIPFAGTALANLAAKSGNTTFGGQTVQQGKQIQQIVPALSAKVNYLLNKRFNSGEAAMLQEQVVPNATDNEASAQQKIGNLQRLTAVMQGGDINALRMVAASIAGRPVNPGLPSSTGQPQGQPQQGSIHQTATQWAQSHPNDPRARAVLAKAQANGGF